ncbi:MULTISPECIES: D-alanyl-D-alanine carboxypeptidase family protein [unclassified Ruegeria]|uniref:D-alanyl-D-alanine carboxypeptidase family protein n=1 Tax=unclassified Ruegeria TaxID=2625375 RepID=UPI00148903FF|nr:MULTISPECIES: D-alanyl-D-alanine carboxypeptidase family protein [unclassified Ruegeria]NOD34830.1 D-alanyl-D-alanine carboxypeptidase [Ruegeria sp. HKCCD7296]NOD48446.1 D-alanyl-D-alanine carboxypeptidase [Ruegeria sp. HKCCD5849]NOD52466.1 D-alanyl-D-alanine carboxypeptidase [Ruegeria sp. HKCCD5851]NOD61755.1 D-alanyl-D-alanine carboxypeptidase [Ruegeria sp. HKCCD6109]NOD68569.1 D-alanyl-D-alanine carboxypeptidase [Ruegeria sp. HKCCD7303]
MLASMRTSVLAMGIALMGLPAHAFDTTARAAYVIDQTTGTVLLSKDADQPLPPASMSKLMTLYVAFEALRDGRLTLNETLPVSEHAMSYGGSTMFLNTQDRVTVEDLLRGIIVLSGNDACVVIAEALSPDGTEAGFARYMTQRAQQMGMNNSNFANSNGWPAAGHMMSVHDLAVLADRLISDFPEYYPLFAEEVFEFDGRAPSNARNRNPLLKLDIGADGLKTGHTQEAGYGLVGSAKQGDRRVIFVLTGLDTTGQRAEEAEAVVNWSFRNFVERTVANAETPIAEAQLWMGEKKTVGLVAEGDLNVLFPVLGTQNVEAEVVYDGPINAPVQKGQQLAELVIKPEGLPEIRRPLVAAEDVAVGGFVVRMLTVGGIVLKDVINNPLESM